MAQEMLTEKDTESLGLAFAAERIATANDALRAGMLIGSNGNDQHTEFLEYDARIRAINKRLKEYSSGWSISDGFPTIRFSRDTRDAGDYGIYRLLFNRENAMYAVDALGERLDELENALEEFCLKYAEYGPFKTLWVWDRERKVHRCWFPQGKYWICEDGTIIEPNPPT